MTSYTIRINLENDAIVENMSAEVAKILRDLADKVESVSCLTCRLYDSNGNQVGAAKIEVHDADCI